MSDSLTATKVETYQCPSHQSILLTQEPIHEIFMKKYWELTKPWKWLLFSFLVFGFWLLGWSKKIFFGFSVCKKPRRFIWGSIYSCTMDGFFRIFKKAVSELICTRLYHNHMMLFTEKVISTSFLTIMLATREYFKVVLVFLWKQSLKFSIFARVCRKR